VGRPVIPEIERLANQLWLARLLAGWRRMDERAGRRFTRAAVARALLSVGPAEGAETTADRERLQALATIQRTGSDPRRCRRFFPTGTALPDVGDDVTDVTVGVARRRRRKSRGRDGQYFCIDAVARAEALIPGSATWYRPALIQVLSPPAMGRDETRALLALELAKLGYIRSKSLVREQARRQYRQGIVDPEIISAELWSRALDPFEHHGTIESLGVLALLLHEQRLSFASEAVCQSISDALSYALESLLADEGLDDFTEPLNRHIYERLWRQRWQADIDDESPDSQGMPVSMRTWLARCRRIPWQERVGGLPDCVIDSSAAEQTIEAMIRALAHAERQDKKATQPSAAALKMTGITELRKQLKAASS